MSSSTTCRTSRRQSSTSIRQVPVVIRTLQLAIIEVARRAGARCLTVPGSGQSTSTSVQGVEPSGLAKTRYLGSRSCRGSNVVPSLRLPTLRRNSKSLNLAIVHKLLPHCPRSAAQERFEHSPITSTDVVGNTTPSRARFPCSEAVLHWLFSTKEGGIFEPMGLGIGPVS